MARPTTINRHCARCVVSLIVTTLVLVVAASSATAGPVRVLKLDPALVGQGQPFSIVYQIDNPRNTPLVVSVDAKTDLPGAPQRFTLAPNESRIGEVAGVFNTAGNRPVTVIVQYQTDQTILVRKGPTDIQKVYVFKELGRDAKSLRVYSTSTPPRRPQFVDLSPNQEDTDNGGGDARSGVVGAIVDSRLGTQHALFAIPKTAGVWRSVNGSPWTFLPGSPPRAFSIAVNPGNPQHIVVGERDDDASDPLLGRSGLWESFDFGNTWLFTYDPAFHMAPGIRAQRIAAAAFGQSTGTLFIATNRGVARRVRSQTTTPYSEPFSYGVRKQSDTDCHATSASDDLGSVSALIASETKVWARSERELFYSDDDGRTWSCWTFPAAVELPGSANVPANFSSDAIGANDRQVLAAFDDQAFVIFQPTITVSNTDPRSVLDPRCNPPDKDSYDSTVTTCQFTSVTGMLIFYPTDKRSLAQFTPDGDGRGLNGRRFVKAYSIPAAACPALAARTVGAGRQVFVGHGQSVQQALSVDSAGRLVFDSPVGTPFWGPVLSFDRTFFLDASGQIVINPVDVRPDFKKPIHPDIWDFLLPNGYCPPGQSTALIATDGGIHQGAANSTTGRLSEMTWTPRNDGLHVATAQDVVATLSTTVPPPVLNGPPVIQAQHVAFPTQDNNAWFRKTDGQWISGGAGDMNFITGNVAPSGTLLSWRSPKNASYVMTDGGFTAVTLNNNAPVDGPTAIQAVQSLAGEPLPNNSLDLVMLVQLPLLDKDGNPFADPPGGSATGSRRALIRNSNFESKPDGPANKFDGWKVVVDPLPQGATRLWTAGGHSKTQYFVFTDASNAACPNGVQQWALSPAGPGGGRAVFAWRCRIANLVDPGGAVHGPAFINPFNPKTMLVTTGAALRMTLDAGQSFCDLPALTALITESGRYSLRGDFGPHDTFNVVASRFHGNSFSVPSQVSFHRFSTPGQADAIVVSSPYTGVYAGDVTQVSPGVCREEWRDLTPALPTAHAYISGVARVGDAAIMSSEGRGIFAVTPIRAALEASYFTTMSSAMPGDPFALLHRSSGLPLPWGSVRVTFTDALTGRRHISDIRIRTDQGGRLFVPRSTIAGSYVVDIAFIGDGAAATAAAKFRLEVR